MNKIKSENKISKQARLAKSLRDNLVRRKEVKKNTDIKSGVKEEKK